MAMVAMAIPVMRGKEQAWLDYTGRLQSSEFREEYAASRRAVGMTREIVWSQRGPDGGLVAIVVVEADDLNAVFGNLASAEDPTTAGFREFIKDVHGVDMVADPLPEVTLHSDTRF
ncbi:MAG TPA: hypothetical protein VGE38_03425 [Nocardioides sp.]|uniref:hypothetical protein n=1 Tax=Nocardioides sp. TaxID=35761 RepID=UPI002EDA6832